MLFNTWEENNGCHPLPPNIEILFAWNLVHGKNQQCSEYLIHDVRGIWGLVGRGGCQVWLHMVKQIISN